MVPETVDPALGVVILSKLIHVIGMPLKDAHYDQGAWKQLIATLF
jgi:hypothetical protein